MKLTLQTQAHLAHAGPEAGARGPKRSLRSTRLHLCRVSTVLILPLRPRRRLGRAALGSAQGRGKMGEGEASKDEFLQEIMIYTDHWRYWRHRDAYKRKIGSPRGTPRAASALVPRFRCDAPPATIWSPHRRLSESSVLQRCLPALPQWPRQHRRLRVPLKDLLQGQGQADRSLA